MARISKKKFKEACTGSGGVQAVVAKAIGVTRQSICIYLKKNPDMKQLLDEEGEKVMDAAEHNIDRDIVAGDIESSKWALTNRKRGKERGYGQKQEVEHLGKIFDVNIREVSNEKDNSEPGPKQETETSVGDPK